MSNYRFPFGKASHWIRKMTGNAKVAGHVMCNTLHWFLALMDLRVVINYMTKESKIA